MSGTVPTIGRIVHYRLDAHDAARITHRRTEAGIPGNAVQPGDTYPLIITRVWGGGSGVNGQVLLDGPDTLWVTSVTEGEGIRTWSWPMRQG